MRDVNLAAIGVMKSQHKTTTKTFFHFMPYCNSPAEEDELVLLDTLTVLEVQIEEGVAAVCGVLTLEDGSKVIEGLGLVGLLALDNNLFQIIAQAKKVVTNFLAELDIVPGGLNLIRNCNSGCLDHNTTQDITPDYLHKPSASPPSSIFASVPHIQQAGKPRPYGEVYC